MTFLQARISRARILPFRVSPEKCTPLLIVLFAASIVRLWLMPLPSSLWVDELVTTFVLRFPHHSSFVVAPQVPDSIYYFLPRLSWRLFGHSEIALRLPSIAAMGAALALISRIAVRTIHPRAAWLAVFLCLAISGIDYFAVDARPYALGIAIACASILFLIRWLDGGRWLDQAIFVACAMALWRIHLFYWPFYLIYPAYTAARLRARDVAARPAQIVVAAMLIPAALIPVAFTALGRLAGAPAHAFNPPPTLREFIHRAYFNVVLICGALAWLLHKLSKLKRLEGNAQALAAGSRLNGWALPLFGAASSGPCAPEYTIRGASWLLAVAWWLVCPVCLFAYSHFSGNGVFIPRYLSLMLPGIALTATAVSARFLPENAWGPAAATVGLIGLALTGQWMVARPGHDNDNWRAAAALERNLADDRTPVLCASPFIEAQAPQWTPDYRLPGFLYSHLTYYPVRGNLKLFPFRESAEANRYAGRLLDAELLPAGRFIVYGPRGGSGYLLKYLGNRPELAGWEIQTESFGNVTISTFDGPNIRAAALARVLRR